MEPCSRPSQAIRPWPRWLRSGPSPRGARPASSVNPGFTTQRTNTKMEKADIGLVGLAVMGENLILNMESRGYTVAVFNRTVDKVDKFMAGRAKGKKIVGAHTLQELVASLKAPRKVMLMVKAGAAVDEFIDHLTPLLSKGDIIIDGGNSHFPDTIRRTKALEAKGLLYIG